MRNAQISAKESVVYWINGFTSELMLAPDTRMKPFVGWMRIECQTAADIEQFSRRMAMQEYNKFRGMKVEEHLRSQKKREALKANCKLRLAQGCVSPEDERLTRQTLQSLERKDQLLYRIIADEPDLSRGCLVIEKQENAIGLAQYGSKKRGLADNEISGAAKIAETTR